jgi:sec-independent protein translocase protein TatC
MTFTEIRDEEKNLSEHINELRKKILIALFIFIAGVTITHVFNAEIIDFLLKPASNQNLIFLSPLDPLFFIFQIDFIGGIIFAFPAILWLLLSYISPALSNKVNKRIFLFFITSTLLLIFGLVYTLFVVAPISLKFLFSIAIPGIENSFSVQKYLSFLITQTIIVMMVFQVPIVIIGGVYLEILKTRFLAVKRKFIYVGLLTALAIITPTTDIFSLAILFIPCLIIFELSLIGAKIVEKTRGQNSNQG